MAGSHDPPTRHCLTCGYIIDHLSAPRCPECGRVFDPDDSSTFVVDEPEAAPRPGHFAALLAVTALLIVPVPWSLALDMRVARPMALAVYAGAATFFSVMLAALFLRRLPAVAGPAVVLPAALMLAMAALDRGHMASAAAAGIGLVSAAVLVAAVRA